MKTSSCYLQFSKMWDNICTGSFFIALFTTAKIAAKVCAKVCVSVCVQNFPSLLPSLLPNSDRGMQMHLYYIWLNYNDCWLSWSCVLFTNLKLSYHTDLSDFWMFIVSTKVTVRRRIELLHLFNVLVFQNSSLNLSASCLGTCYASRADTL